MKVITILLLIASVALNVCFFAGCESVDDGKSELVRIASLLNIKTSGKSASDLSSDIRYKLDRSVEVPATFAPAAFEKMTKDLRVEEKEAMGKYHQFISDLQGKRVIVIEPEN